MTISFWQKDKAFGREFWGGLTDPAEVTTIVRNLTILL